MAHYKLNDADENFLKIPLDAQVIFAGAGGTETWIERDRDSVVRIEVKAIAVATSDGGTLQACIQIGEDSAKGEDGPFPADGQCSSGVMALAAGASPPSLRVLLTFAPSSGPPISRPSPRPTAATPTRIAVTSLPRRRDRSPPRPDARLGPGLIRPKPKFFEAFPCPWLKHK